MVNDCPFDLPGFFFANFNRVDLGGDLFGQWPAGLRFEIGVDQIARAIKLFEFVFGKADDCILVSQDWFSRDIPAVRYTPLFKTPGVFPIEPSIFQEIEVLPWDESKYRLTWTRLSPLGFNAALMFQGIANREQPGQPKVASGVYVIDARLKLIMHMYDDRGLDVIATKLSILRPLYESFSDWILHNQRHRIDFRFRSDPDQSPD
jgi:hypothetical protein